MSRFRYSTPNLSWSSLCHVTWRYVWDILMVMVPVWKSLFPPKPFKRYSRPSGWLQLPIKLQLHCPTLKFSLLIYVFIYFLSYLRENTGRPGEKRDVCAHQLWGHPFIFAILLPLLAGILGISRYMQNMTSNHFVHYSWTLSQCLLLVASPALISRKR